MAMIKRVLRGVTSRSLLAIKSSRGDVFATSAVTLRLKRISVAVRADSSTLTTKRQDLDWLQPCRGSRRPVRTTRPFSKNPSCWLRRSASSRYTIAGREQAILFSRSSAGISETP